MARSPCGADFASCCGKCSPIWGGVCKTDCQTAIEEGKKGQYDIWKQEAVLI